MLIEELKHWLNNKTARYLRTKPKKNPLDEMWRKGTEYGRMQVMIWLYRYSIKNRRR